MDKMTISLAPHLARAVERAVAAGDYASTDEAVSEALRDWSNKRDASGRYTADDLKRLVAEGLASGFLPHDSMDAIKAEGRRRLRDRGGST